MSPLFASRTKGLRYWSGWHSSLGGRFLARFALEALAYARSSNEWMKLISI